MLFRSHFMSDGVGPDVVFQQRMILCKKVIETIEGNLNHANVFLGVVADVRLVVVEEVDAFLFLQPVTLAVVQKLLLTLETNLLGQFQRLFVLLSLDGYGVMPKDTATDFPSYEWMCRCPDYTPSDTPNIGYIRCHSSPISSIIADFLLPRGSSSCLLILP